MAEQEKEPSIEEIAKEMGDEPKNIVMAMDAIKIRFLCLSRFIMMGRYTFVMDQVSDEKNGDRLWLENLSLSEAMQHLNEREKKIVNLRFLKANTDRGQHRNRH